MPSIDTIVQDINSGTIVGVGAKPPPNIANSTTSVISAPHKIKYFSELMKATISPTNRLACDPAQGLDFNGNYLHYADGFSTIANMDVNRRLVVSGNFSGCMYKIFDAGQGAFKCAHIARPGGANSDSLVQLIDIYAGQYGWTPIRSIPTVGLIGTNGCKEVIVLSRLITNTRIETARLQVNNQGLIVAKDVWADDL